MATYCETVMFTDTETPSCDSVEISTDRLAVLIRERPGSPSLLTVHGTLEQLESIARQLERLVTLRRHDLDDDRVSLTPAGEAALGELGAASEPGGVEDFARRLRPL